MSANVRITAALRRAIHEDSSTAVVQVRSAADFDIVARVVAAASREYWDELPRIAIEAGITDLEEGDSPRFMSDPVAVPGGLVVWADCHDMPAEAVLLWPEVIRRHLTDASDVDATITTPRRNEDLYRVRHTCRLVSLTAYLPPDDSEYEEGVPRQLREAAIE